MLWVETVKTALNIVCFPENDDINILGEILSGGLSKVQEAGGIFNRWSFYIR